MKNLNADLKNGTFLQVYLLTGEEAYLKNRYKKRLRAAIVGEDDLMNFTAYTGKGIDIRQVIETAETMPFFCGAQADPDSRTADFSRTPARSLRNICRRCRRRHTWFFVEQEIDKRGEALQGGQAQGRIVELGRQDARTLTTWVLGMIKKEGKNITQDALNLFLEKSGDDMENIANELEKLLCYVQDATAIERADVEAICTVTTENKIFDMIRAVAEKRQKQALELYYDLLSLKEPPMRILFLIARQFNQMYQIKDLREQGYDSGAIAKKAGLAPFIAKKSLAQASKFEKDTLRQAVEDCVETEAAVKSGRLGDRLGVELLIVKYSS